MGVYENVVGGVSSIVANNFKPWWEGIQGTVDAVHYDGHLSPREAYKLGGLDFDVLEREIRIDVGINDEDANWQNVPSHKALINANTRQVLGIHGADYGVLQYEVLAEFGEALKLVGDDVDVRSAGTLFDSKVGWMLFKLGEDTHFAGQDERIAKYLAVSTSHDGSIALTARPTDVRIECMNTFAMHESDKAVVKLRHTSRVADRVEQAKQVVSAAYNRSHDLDKEIAELLSTSWSEASYKNALVPALNPRPAEESSSRTKTLWEGRQLGLLAAYDRPDAANIKGTAWGAIMGINSYEIWSQTVRGSTRPESQAKRALTGKFPLTQKARAMVLR